MTPSLQIATTVALAVAGARPLVFAGEPEVAPVRLVAGLQAPSAKFSHGDRAEDGSVWNVVFRSGVHLSPYAEGGAVELDTRKAILDMVESFSAVIEEGWHGAGQGIPFRVDPDHSMGGWFGGNPDPLASAGQILELASEELPNGDLNLLARVQWTDYGRKALEVFRSCSVEFWLPGQLRHRAGPLKGEPIDQHVLTGIVLTNHPMVVGMPPVAASTHRHAPAPRGTTTPESPMAFKLTTGVLALLCLSEHASDDAVNEKIQALATEREKAQEQLSEKADQVKSLSADLEQVTQERDQLRATEIDRAADRALEEGRIRKPKRERYVELATKFGVAFADETFDEQVVKTSPRSPSNRSEGGEKPPAGAGSADAVVAAIEARAAELEKGGMAPPAAYAAAQDEYVHNNPGALALLAGGSAEA